MTIMPKIIDSMLDDDLYKFTMQYAVMKYFPYQKVCYTFKDRSNTVYPDGFDIQLKNQIDWLTTLKLSKGEKAWFKKTCGHFLPPTYFDFLEGYRYDNSEVEVYLDNENHLVVRISGYWYRTILWEVKLLAIISELYYLMTGQIVDIYNDDLITKDVEKCNAMYQHNAFFADFGTRRRYSRLNQDTVVARCKQYSNGLFVGSSNVYLAMKYDVKPIGTHAHEWFMVHAALYGYKMANKISMDNWIGTYNGSLGTALTDTYTTDEFIKVFDSYYARLFDGPRQDSGDEIEYANKFIKLYKSLGIDPMTKTIIFSNALTVERAIQIKEYCAGKIKCSFGIGTTLMNDVGVKPMNIVIKVSEVLINDKWIPAVKLSDDLEKNTGYKDEVIMCKKILYLD